MKGSLVFINLFIIIVVLSFSTLNAQQLAYDFSAIDVKAKDCPKKLHRDLPKLVSFLTEDANNELEQVRAIYSWITMHIDYDWEAAENDKRINHFTNDILQRKLALCFGYAQLFEEMCDLQGIKSHRVNGYAKSIDSTQVNLQVPNHSWNAVQIDQEWYLLDATWGSISPQQMDDLGQASRTNYFLVNPKNFVRTHLPGNPIWQLLSNPVSPQTFLDSDSAILQHIVTQQDSVLAFRDSIKDFSSFSPAKKRLVDYDRTYQSYPNEKNGKELGHALIDYAGLLSDTLELLSQETNQVQWLQLNTQILQYCRRASSLARFYPWQQELFVNTLINQAVFKYNYPKHSKLAFGSLLKEVSGLLKEAQQLLVHSENSYFARMAKAQCESYLEMIKQATR